MAVESGSDYGTYVESGSDYGTYGDYGDSGDDVDLAALEAECGSDIDCWNEAFEDLLGAFEDFDYGNDYGTDYGTDDYGTDDYGTDYEMSLAQVADATDDYGDYGDYGDDIDWAALEE